VPLRREWHAHGVRLDVGVGLHGAHLLHVAGCCYYL
jgi:hypothetical protein